MEKKTIEVKYFIDLEYDENSPEFIEAYESYIECIDKTATKDDMVKQVAWYIQRFGVKSMVEGVGCVWVDGEEKPDNYCGIKLTNDIDDTEVDFY